MLERKKRNKIDIIADAIKYVIIFIVTFLCIYPFYYVVIYSISDPTLAATGIYLWPKGFDLTTYKELLGRDDLLRSFLISAARTVAGTAITVGCTSLLAFLITRKEMIGRKFVYRYTIITMYLSAGLIPWYIVMKAYNLQNSFFLYIIPGAVSAYYMILIKTFIEQLPESLEEAAVVEGAGFFDLFFRIVMPLSKPIIATICVYCAVSQWNSWQDNFFLVTDKNLQTLQYILYKFLNSASEMAKAMQSGNVGVMQTKPMISAESVKMASIVVTMVPVMFVYPFAQKYFTKGIMLGAVKG